MLATVVVMELAKVLVEAQELVEEQAMQEGKVPELALELVQALSMLRV